MQSIKLQSHVGPDGILKLEVPTSLPNTDLEVMVILQPVTPASTSKTPEELGWPPGFFEQTYGSLKDDPIDML